MRAYCRRTGRQDIDARDWEFYMAFSMFRMTAILQGIARRAIDGTSADPDAHEVGKRARAVAASIPNSAARTSGRDASASFSRVSSMTQGAAS